MFIIDDQDDAGRQARDCLRRVYDDLPSDPPQEPFDDLLRRLSAAERKLGG